MNKIQACLLVTAAIMFFSCGVGAADKPTGPTKEQLTTEAQQLQQAFQNLELIKAKDQAELENVQLKEEKIIARAKEIQAALKAMEEKEKKAKK